MRQLFPCDPHLTHPAAKNLRAGCVDRTVFLQGDAIDVPRFIGGDIFLSDIESDTFRLALMRLWHAA